MKIQELRENRKKIEKFLDYKLGYYYHSLLSANNNGKTNSVIIASAHKVGSTWLHKILRCFYIYQYNKVPGKLRTSAINPWMLSLEANETLEFLKNKTKNNLFKSHSKPPTWVPTESIKFVTVYRDPRDLTISNIFFLANLPPELGGWKEMKALDTKKRIKLYLKKGTFDLELLQEWYEYPHALKLAYEDMLNHPFEEIKKTARHIEASVDDNRIRKAIEKNSFKSLSAGRKRGVENKNSFFRKGISGDWLNYFDEELVEYFKSVHNGRWNKLLVDLGYETDPDWTIGKNF